MASLTKGAKAFLSIERTLIDSDRKALRAMFDNAISRTKQSQIIEKAKSIGLDKLAKEMADDLPYTNVLFI